MRSVWSGFCVAFSMYSSIPVPQVPWEKRTMRWALSFLPLVGVLVGGLELFWLALCTALDAAPLFYSAVAALLPLVVSGGIHLDGLTDTCDALCSFGSREKRLDILKDPHVGAFGPMWLVAFLLAQTGLFAQLYAEPVLAPVGLCGFALARALGGRKIVAMPCAKDSGLAYLFAEGSDKRAVARTLAAEAAVLSGVCLLLGVGLGRGGWAAVWAAAVPLLLTGWSALHRRLSLRVFGGVTGDLAGFYISTAELLALAAAAMGGLFV